MSQPFSPQPGQQPPRPLPQQPAYAPTPAKPPNRKRFGFLALGLAALAGLVVGGTAFGVAGNSAGTAAPATTVTATATATVTEPAAEGGSEPTEPPPVSEPTEAPAAAWDPKPKDFKLTVKTTDKECFGSAGCNISYELTLDYLGSQDVPAEGTTDITYEVTGAEQEIIGTIELNSEGRYDSPEESTQTTSESKTLKAKVTEVDYNEFG